MYMRRSAYQNDKNIETSKLFLLLLLTRARARRRRQIYTYTYESRVPRVCLCVCMGGCVNRQCSVNDAKYVTVCVSVTIQ